MSTKRIALDARENVLKVVDELGHIPQAESRAHTANRSIRRINQPV